MFQPCLSFAKIFSTMFTSIPILVAALKTHRDFADDTATLSFYLGSNKSEWFSKSLDSLGAIISDDGIEVDPAKWERIRQWPTPHNKTDVQRFLGTVNWMRDHLPHLSITLEPITALLAQSTSWRWNEREQQAFDTVKSLVPATLRPIDGAKVTSGEHKIYLFTDASRVGIGACLASGPTRSQAIPTDSSPLSSMALSSIITSLIRKVTPKPRHIRMCLELSRFDFEFEFIAGKNNSLADSLSRLWEVKEDRPRIRTPRIHTHGESLPEERPYTSPSPDRLPPVDFAFGPQRDDCEAGSPGYYALKDESQDEDVNGRDLGNLFLKEECHEFTTPGESLPEERPYTHLRTSLPLLIVPSALGSRLRRRLSRFHRLAENIMDAVDSSTVSSLFVPRGLATGVVDSDKLPSLRELVLSEIHRSVGHAGHRITLAAIRPLYWWSSMSADCAKFCHSCEDCARGKASTQVPYGRLHPMPIPSGPWEQVAIDFMTGLPPVEFEGMMVAQIMVLVADRYYATIFRLHGTPSAIVSDRDPKFTSQFWRALAGEGRHRLADVNSGAPETDGSSENRIKMAWASRLVEAEFALNSSVAVSTSLSAFEATYGYLPRRWPTDSWSVSDVPRAEALPESDSYGISMSRMRSLVHASIRLQANKHRRPDDPAFDRQLCHLSTKNLPVPEGMKSKLLPRYIGPFRIRAAIPATSSYDLELPPAMSRVHILFVEDVADAADNSAIPERIVRDRRNARGNRSFLVRWIGRKDIDDTWMSEQSLRFGPSIPTRRYWHNSIAQIAACPPGRLPSGGDNVRQTAIH
ncbi:BZ3500_MvSof-1268-A1-R1_C057g00248 [Microbotryum saponariae]|uniref:BZ3500_MvSof-1268-A1-R1_C057g00248 protein n=1 Tax=Microbotryum saponariae TaxID=289078 RepID=A0A2X0MSX2_9BASI|nr:BZ3500_MvSof-1268-A1-R1_C057g00248 [Microbotryum saponariae]